MTIHSTNEQRGEASVPQARPWARWSRSPGVLDRPTRQGVMVLPSGGAAVLLTGLTARVWRALEQPVPGDQLAERLAQLGGAAAGGRAAGPGPSPAEVAAALRDLQAIGAVREIR